jgi:hypothetical protein
MPVDQAADWAKHEASWIRRQQRIGWTLPDKYGDLVEYVASADVDAACALVSAVLSPLPSAVVSPSLIQEPPGRLEWYELEQFMEKSVAALIAADPRRAFSVFGDLLAEVVAETGDSHGFDDSRFWRPSIGQGRGMYRGRRDELVSAVTESSQAAIRAGAMTVTDVIAALDARTAPIFGRITQFIIGTFPEGLGGRIAVELHDIDVLVGSDRGELRQLLRNGLAAAHRRRD